MLGYLLVVVNEKIRVELKLECKTWKKIKKPSVQWINILVQNIVKIHTAM